MNCNHVDKKLCVCNDQEQQRQLEILNIKKHILRDLLIENGHSAKEIDRRIKEMEEKATHKYSDA